MAIDSFDGHCFLRFHELDQHYEIRLRLRISERWTCRGSNFGGSPFGQSQAVFDRLEVGSG